MSFSLEYHCQKKHKQWIQSGAKFNCIVLLNSFNLLGKIRKKTFNAKTALLHWTSKSCELLYMYMHPKLKQCWLSYASLSKHIALLANFPTIIHQCLKPNHTWSKDVGSLSVQWLSCTFHVKFNSFPACQRRPHLGKSSAWYYIRKPCREAFTRILSSVKIIQN